MSRKSLACLYLALLLAGPAAQAQERRPPAPGPAPAGQRDEFNFELLDKLSPAESAAREQKAARLERAVRLRRAMLTTHQAFGFASLAMLTTTVVVGQLNYVDKYTSGDFTERYQVPHLGLAITTSALFATTAMLALLAPTPYPKPGRADAMLVHKIMMGLASAGMVTQLVLGPVTASRVGRLDQPRDALGHLIVGYATWSFMATGVLALVF